MELIEREACLSALHQRYKQMIDGSGHTLFIMGDAGVGKTTLVTAFINDVQKKSRILQGACDSLFTPRPLGPLYDIAVQIGREFFDILQNEQSRPAIFASFLQELTDSALPTILIFEDIHWADEATTDFIKFLSRRIASYRCLFLVTYRDDEMPLSHPVRQMFGELPSQNFSKLAVNPFSITAVNELALLKGYNSGEKIFFLTGGNPFYVTEILASYSPGIPERIKDSILAVFYSKDEKTQALWELLSILPSRIDLVMVDEIEREFPNSIRDCIQSGVIVERSDYLSFKHELYRITIEELLSVYRRRDLHKKMLSILLESPLTSSDKPRLLHHAKFADNKIVLATIAPAAAKEASQKGSHREAAEFYQLAIDATPENNETIAALLEHHAYECYLTNQINAAITSQTKALEIWRMKKVRLREGDVLRFLSRIWWFAGNRANAVPLAMEAIAILENGFPTRERALAYSNFAQLQMLADNCEQALDWGNKAIELATRINDDEVLCHSLNNVGSARMRYAGTAKAGEKQLLESLSIALAKNFPEHAARAYTNLSFSYILNKDYKSASSILEDGLKYCEDHDLMSWTYYMLSEKAKLHFAIGLWESAEEIAVVLYDNKFHPAIVRIGAIGVLSRLAIRRGRVDASRALIQEGKNLARLTNEAQRIVPMLVAELELCWMLRETPPAGEINAAEEALFPAKNDSWHFAELCSWMRRCNLTLNGQLELQLPTPFDLEYKKDWEAAAAVWEKIGCKYEQALALFENGQEDQRRAIIILEDLDASAISEMMRMVLRQKGMKNIPRGLRESTRSNPAQLTTRQIDVLQLLRQGLQNREIAARLFISPKTVDHHISAILSHLEVNSRAKAVVEAVRLGILR